MGLFSPKPVECRDCQHLIRREVAQVIPVEPGFVGSYYYCPEHRKPYEKVKWNDYFWGKYVQGVYGKPRFIKEFEVDEDGTPVGFAPKKK